MKNAMGMKRFLSVALCLCLLLSTGVFGKQQVRAADAGDDAASVTADETADNVSATADEPQDFVVEHDHDGWTAWSEELTASQVIASGKYFLEDDLELTEATYYIDSEVTLCLNGHTITSGASSISVEADGVLTLTDCTDEGMITGGTTSPVFVNGGTFILENGTISGNAADMGAGVYVESGDFIMKGGSISGNTAQTYGGGVYMLDGVFTMQGGSISGNAGETNGGGVYINDGAFTMESGTISDNNATSSQSIQTTGNGGGVYMYAGAFIMQGGEISANTAMRYGGGVEVYDGTFTMENGSISENTAKFSGGGLDVYYGTFTMQDGTISGNTVGGVSVRSGSFTMQDGLISDNDGGSSDGGVYVGSGDFTMQGGEISRNSSTTYGSGVYLNSGSFTMEGGKIFNNKETKYGGGVYVNSGSFTMEGGEISDNSASNGSGVYLNNKTATFTMKGGKISGSTGYLTIGGGVFSKKGSFIMENGEISGNEAGFGGGVFVDSTDATFTMEGGTISGNSATNSAAAGGGVYVDSGSFTMKGGKISGNSTREGNWTNSMRGGGVAVSRNGMFILQGGEISGNTAGTYGGGVSVEGAFHVSGNPIVAGNTLSDAVTESNVGLADATKYIQVAGELTDGAKLGVSRYTDVKETPVLTEGYSAYHTDDAGKYFFYDNAESFNNCDVGTGPDGEAWFGYNVTFADRNGHTLEEQFVGYNCTATPYPLDSDGGDWSTELGGAAFDFDTAITANLTLYTDTCAHNNAPVLEQEKRQIKFTANADKTAVEDAFDFRVVSRISSDDWNAYFANTGTSDTSKNAITEIGFVAYKGMEGFSLDAAKAAAKEGKTTGDYYVATANYIQHAAGSDAKFSAMIHFSSAHSDVTYMAYVQYNDADGAPQYLFYEAEKTALLKTDHDKLVKQYLEFLNTK